ncbi:ferrous iron transporter B [Clostridia bacterium]|nr:ferrous iron transporter B [Clostridia bacterium]
MKLYLVGNPNVGKTTLYNRLTKSFEHIGNWHGVTVKAARAKFRYNGEELTLTDLPGLYSLNAAAPEEEVSRDAILKRDGAIVCVCEVNNLARNLYLFLQLKERGIPAVLAINMTDELRLQKRTIDYGYLARELETTVVPISAKYGRNLNELADACISQRTRNNVQVKGSGQSEDKIVGAVCHSSVSEESPSTKGKNRNCALCIVNCALNKDKTAERFRRYDISDKNNIEKNRYDYIDRVIARAVRSESVLPHGYSRLDKILLNKYLALPLFLGILAVVFYWTFGLIGKYMTAGMKLLIDLLGGGLDGLLNRWNAPAWLAALVSDGIVGGAGTVFTFLPQITLLFLFLAFLEDTGYLARVAFMTDGLFRKAGLSGRSAFTLLMGFGCTTTAVLTARGLESEAQRKKTVLLTPFMSCSARLPVYSVVAAAFFVDQWLLIFGLYALGAAVALALSLLLEKVPALKSPEPAFIMEMPPYRLPTAGRVGRIIWKNVRLFLSRVATVVFGLSVIVWILSNFSFAFRFVPENLNAKSMTEWVGMWLAWLFKPLGFGSWQAATALLSGFVAKETVVSTLESLSGSGGLAAVFGGNKLSALSFCAFVLLYAPCVSAAGAIKQELGRKWMWFSVGLSTGVAYSVSFVVYWIGKLVAVGAWFSLIAVACVIIGVALFVPRKKRALFNPRKATKRISRSFFYTKRKNQKVKSFFLYDKERTKEKEGRTCEYSPLHPPYKRVRSDCQSCGGCGGCGKMINDKR